MSLLPNWKTIVRKAWSVRFIVLCCIFTAADALVPLFYSDLPDRVFAILSAVSATGALISRLMVQGDLNTNPK